MVSENTQTDHCLNTRVMGFDFAVGYPTKEWMRFALFHVPFMQLFHIGNAVEPGIRLHDVGILGEQPIGNDSTPMVLSLELRVGEAKEELVHTSTGTVLGEG